MTDDSMRINEDSADRQEERLSDHLESLYRSVASADSGDAGIDATEDQDIYYKILQIPLGAAMSDIRSAYERMTGLWDPGRYPHVPSWEEKATSKLREIKHAYEKIVALYPVRQKAGSRVAPLKTGDLIFSEEPGREAAASARPPSGAFWLQALPDRRWLFASGALVAAVLLFFFVWPILYHYDAIRVGDRDYPLRINRLTTHAQYFDGGQWLEPPLQDELPLKASQPFAPLPSSVQPSGAGSRAASGSISSPQALDATPTAVKGVRAAPLGATARTPEEAESAQTRSLEDRLPQGGSGLTAARASRTEIRRDERPASPVPATAKKRSGDQILAGTGRNGGYSIQVGAFPERGKAERLATEMLGRKYEVRVEPVSLQNRGRWHRILVGTFASREDALRYLRDQRIGEAYPGSFVQKASTRPR